MNPTGSGDAETREQTITTVWPSIAVFPMGQWLGRLYDIRWPGVSFFRLGNAIALASIPLALVLYFYRVFPWRGIRYRLTDRHLIIERGLQPREESSIGLEEFDAATIDVRPGQAWFHAGDIVFTRQGQEVFRLGGVSRPEVFWQNCRRSQMAFVTVRQISQR